MILYGRTSIRGRIRIGYRNDTGRLLTLILGLQLFPGYK